MIDRDLLKQALGYMESVGQMDMHPEEWAIAVALRERLAQPEQWEQFYPDMGKPQPNTIANSEAIPEQISEHSSDCALLQIPSRDCDCGA